MLRLFQLLLKASKSKYSFLRSNQSLIDCALQLKQFTFFQESNLIIIVVSCVNCKIILPVILPVFIACFFCLFFAVNV